MATISLDDLNPEWITDNKGRYGQGVAFTCPHCLGADEPTRLGIPFSNPLDGKEPMQGATARWDRVGTEFSDLTIGDSIRIPEHGTVTITKGEVEYSPFVHHEPTAVALEQSEGKYVHLPAKQRVGLGLRFKCPHCDEIVQLLFANPLDGGAPVAGDSFRWQRQGGIRRENGKDFATLENLSIGGLSAGVPPEKEKFVIVEINLGEHGRFTIEHGHILVPGA